MSDRSRILLVDDEAYVLEALRDALRPRRQEWAMSFAHSGEDALALLRTEPHDVVVTDLRMPGMDGATLLAGVRYLQPTALRIVLSGHAELGMVARAAGVAHRMLAKPCEVDELVRVIERSRSLQELFARIELGRRTAGPSTLPSVPRLYLELTGLLASGEASVADAAQIVEQDMAMAAKVLQLANSAYFGRRQRVVQVREAVAYLGLDTLRALALCEEAFRQFRLVAPIPSFDIDQLQRHCHRVAWLAHTIWEETRAGEDPFAAALLHDLGLLVLATEDGGALSEMIVAALREQRPLHEVQTERTGLCGAEIGGYLLSLWGLPHGVTDAVASHHLVPDPAAGLDPVAITYIANVLVEQAEAAERWDSLPPAPLDGQYLERAGLESSVERWRAMAVNGAQKLAA